MRSSLAMLGAAALVSLPAMTATAADTPLGTAFTYQGKLSMGGTPVNEPVDLQFRLYDEIGVTGILIGSMLTATGVTVTDGVFTVDLDFGAQFQGSERWLEIDVKLASGGVYETLAPRQPVMPAPVALFSLDTGPISSPSFVGTYSEQVELTNAGNTIAGDGAGLTNLSAGSIGSGTVTSALNLTNAGNTFAGNGNSLTNLNWGSLTNVPSGFADGIDNDTDTTVWSTDGTWAWYTSGSVGIGTSIPIRPLHVSGQGGTLSNGMRITHPTEGSSWDLLIGGSGTSFTGGFSIADEANEKLTIDAAGNVGIGTTGPDDLLHVYGATDPTIKIQSNGTNEVSGRLSMRQSNDTGVDMYFDGSTGVESLTFEGFASGSPIGKYMVINNGNGNVGIGTTSPGADNRLHVLSDSSLRVVAETTSSGFAGYRSKNADAEYFAGILTGSETYAIYDSEANATRLAVIANGNVGVGTSDPETLLHLSGGSDASLSTGSGYLQIGSYAGSNIVLDNNEIIARGSNGATGTLFLNNDGGNVHIGNNVGTGRLIVPVIEITGGADIVEGFETTNDVVVEPGTVMVIDPAHPGALTASTEAYDFKVAGVVSGAGGVQPGIHLGQDGVLDGDTKVAMTGRVYVKCSNENGAIRPGDRLTTAALAGHAMKATDASRSDGAVIGKAMSSLDPDVQGTTGLVLVLVNLQ